MVSTSTDQGAAPASGRITGFEKPPEQQDEPPRGHAATLPPLSRPRQATQGRSLPVYGAIRLEIRLRSNGTPRASCTATNAKPTTHGVLSCEAIESAIEKTS